MNLGMQLVRFLLAAPQFSENQRAVMKPARTHELDGIRGWAALIVVLFHIFWETFGVIVPSFRNPVTAFLLDGGLAVSTFFVLSGDALSSSYFAGKGNFAVFELAVRRYPRLMIPILTTMLVVFSLYESGLCFNNEAAVIVQRPDWLGEFLNFPLTLGYSLQYSMISVFTMTGKNQMDPFLWTMKVEFVGSFIVFALLLSRRYQIFPRMIMLVLIVLLISPPYKYLAYISCFLAGVLFAEIRAVGGFDTLQRTIPSIFGWISIALLCILDSVEHMTQVSSSELAAQQTYRLQCLISIMFVFCIFSNKAISSFFNTSLSRFLGRISFPLYLVQYPIILALLSWLIVRFNAAHQMTYGGVWVIALLSLSGCLIAAIMFLPIEALTHTACRRLSAWILPRLFHKKS